MENCFIRCDKARKFSDSATFDAICSQIQPFKGFVFRKATAESNKAVTTNAVVVQTKSFEDCIESEGLSQPQPVLRAKMIAT